ncbi:MULTISPECIES: hypothetical protein [unclassified Burkholderia]|uniref:hypothetical protein n=1 Tax=unclassified Burkholderia TaxID=2613784 RepID=UPI000F571AE0|nr:MULTISPECIES: hypothetical protein [unclassified Burkholderia]
MNEADQVESFRRVQRLPELVRLVNLSNHASGRIRKAPDAIITGLFDRNHPGDGIRHFVRFRIKVFPEIADSRDETVVKR